MSREAKLAETSTNVNQMEKINMKQGNTKNVPAVTAMAGLAGRAVARLEAAAEKVHAEASEQRELQLISTKAGEFQAIIRHGKTIVEISGNDFAVRQTD